MPLNLRPAQAEDALPILEWQRHPDTRRFARESAIPSETEHLKWYARKIASPDSQFLIAEAEGVRVGFLRLDRHGDEWQLSIVVAPEARYHGVGTAMLRLLASLQGTRRLVAEVLPGNDGSHRLFQSAGWRSDGDGIYRKP